MPAYFGKYGGIFPQSYPFPLNIVTPFPYSL